MTLVIKIGGGAGVATASILSEIAELVRAGLQVVLLHGVSDLTNTLAQVPSHRNLWALMFSPFIGVPNQQAHRCKTPIKNTP